MAYIELFSKFKRICLANAEQNFQQTKENLNTKIKQQV